MVSFNPKKDIPSLAGKVILVTGGNIGLGKQNVLEYARHGPSEIWLACRSASRGEAAIEEIQSQLPTPATIKFLELDLSSLSSVQKAAKRVLSEATRLDILMMNAGVMGSAPSLSPDGYEIQFAVNYLGHALLAKLLLPLLQKTSELPDADVRAVMLSSYGHNMAPGAGVSLDAFRTECADMGPFERYGQSKLAQILWAKHVATLYPKITFVAVHPGLVSTNLANSSTGASWLWRAILRVTPAFAKTPEEGVKNQLWASVGKNVISGEYYEPVGVGGKASALGKDAELAEKLWSWTEKELKTFEE